MVRHAGEDLSKQALSLGDHALSEEEFRFLQVLADLGRSRAPILRPKDLGVRCPSHRSGLELLVLAGVLF